MSQSASQASIFYADIAKSRIVWTMRDDSGFATFPTKEKLLRFGLIPKNRKAMGFWSSESRVKKAIVRNPSFAAFYPVAIDWDVFADRWIKGMTRDRLLVGVNWSGERLTGYDIEPEELLQSVNAAIARLESDSA